MHGLDIETLRKGDEFADIQSSEPAPYSTTSIANQVA
jgi:hypothetical protein